MRVDPERAVKDALQHGLLALARGALRRLALAVGARRAAPERVRVGLAHQRRVQRLLAPARGADPLLERRPWEAAEDAEEVGAAEREDVAGGDGDGYGSRRGAPAGGEGGKSGADLRRGGKAASSGARVRREVYYPYC